MVSPLLDGDGNYSYEIGGEAQLQAALQSITGVDGVGLLASTFEQECLAVLVPNASDRDDVRVEINGREVGSLSRSDAAEYHEALGWTQSFHQTFACRALITGAWDQSVGVFNLNVGLDLMWPPRLGGATEPRAAAALRDEEDAFEERQEIRPRRRRWRGLAGTWLAGGVVSLALLLGLWLLPADNSRKADQPVAATSQAAGPAVPTRSASSETQPAEMAQLPAETPQTPACPDAETAARAWEIVKNSGVVRSMNRAGDISVEESLWEGLPREDRIRFAFAGYCRLPTDASRSILVVGANNGKVMGSIVRGVWLDPASATP